MLRTDFRCWWPIENHQHNDSVKYFGFKFCNFRKIIMVFHLKNNTFKIMRFKCVLKWMEFCSLNWSFSHHPFFLFWFLIGWKHWVKYLCSLLSSLNVSIDLSVTTIFVNKFFRSFLTFRKVQKWPEMTSIRSTACWRYWEV